MQPIYSNTDIITIYRKNFLCVSIDDTTPLDASLFLNKLCIYAIINLKNNLKYIGKTTNLLNRANNYIWNIRNYNESESSLMRSINKAMIDEGINNFRMIPIDIASNREQSIAVWGNTWHFSWNGHAEYLSIVSLIEDMLDNFSTKSFEKMGYHCFFLNYNDDLNNPENLKTFVVQNIDNAFQYILLMNDDESLLLE